jgi:ATP/maltotriose-dependent transcriptional regulator MalT
MTTFSEPKIAYASLGFSHLDLASLSCSDMIEGMQCAVHLLEHSQYLCDQKQGGASRLCQEVTRITNERAQLCLERRRAPRKMQLPPDTLLTLPVQFKQRVFGVLCVAMDREYPDRPALPLLSMQLMARVCSWILFTLEQSHFLLGQEQLLDYHVYGSLTPREQEVLYLMYQGYNLDQIAERLCIAPGTVSKHRQHIYECLGVHCQRDALLAAYHMGLISLMED